MEVVGCVGDDDPAVVAVGGEGGRDVAAAQLVERVAFPRVLLAAVDGQFDDTVAERVERGPERAAGGDFGELVVVADEHDLGADCGGLVDDRGDVAGAGHRRFVDDDQRGGGDLALFDGWRAIVVDVIPAPSCSSRAARADGASPITSHPASS